MEPIEIAIAVAVATAAALTTKLVARGAKNLWRLGPWS